MDKRWFPCPPKCDLGRATAVRPKRGTNTTAEDGEDEGKIPITPMELIMLPRVAVHGGVLEAPVVASFGAVMTERLSVAP